MPKGRKRVCVLCGKPIDDNNDSVPYKGRYAHSACFRVAVKAVHTDKTEKLEQKAKTQNVKKEKTSKPKTELKDSLSEEEYIQKKMYFDYLKQFLGNVLPVKIYAITERYIQQYGFTYQKMYQTLTYLKNIVGKEFTEDIVGLIPYYYDKAEQHYYLVKKVDESNKDKDIDGMYKCKIIYIDTKRKQRKQIDVTSVGKEE